MKSLIVVADHHRQNWRQQPPARKREEGRKTGKCRDSPSLAQSVSCYMQIRIPHAQGTHSLARKAAAILDFLRLLSAGRCHHPSPCLNNSSQDEYQRLIDCCRRRCRLKPRTWRAWTRRSSRPSEPSWRATRRPAPTFGSSPGCWPRARPPPSGSGRRRTGPRTSLRSRASR